MAAYNGHAHSVKSLLEGQAEPNQIMAQNGTFPLLLAAQNGPADSMRSLLEGRAEPNQINAQDGNFPLLLAAQNGPADSVRFEVQRPPRAQEAPTTPTEPKAVQASSVPNERTELVV